MITKYRFLVSPIPALLVMFGLGCHSRSIDTDIYFFTNLSEGNPLFTCLPLQCWTVLIEQFYLLLDRICDSSTTSQNLSTHSKRSIIWWITKASQSLWEQNLSFRQHQQFVNDCIWIKIHVFNRLAFRFFSSCFQRRWSLW